MARARTLYVCRSCGSAFHKWMGKCSDCGAWDSLDAQQDTAGIKHNPQADVVDGWSADVVAAATAPVAVSLAQLSADSPEPPRLSTGLPELDRVLGGHDHAAGLVPGSAVLIGGEPGIGKSTLLLQACGGWASRRARTLYATSEESAEQVRGRADRLGLGPLDDLFVLADTNLARIIEQARRHRPAVIVVDSIQMIFKPDLDAAPGSATQLRRCAADLIYLAKATGTAVVLVGHVTKEGTIAGPRLLEHLVDTVLYFEGDRFHTGRIVRAIKNRFGTTLEIGLFDMTGAGLAERRDTGIQPLATPQPGAVACPVMQGSRCLITELQALTATGFLGAAKRKASGLDSSRLAMLIAVLEQHAGLRLADCDVFAQAVGGARVVEPAADLAILLAIAGAHYRRPIGPGTVALGEVGLGGELRAVPQMEVRLHEASRLGFQRVLVPHAHATDPALARSGLEPLPCRTVNDAIASLG